MKTFAPMLPTLENMIVTIGKSVIDLQVWMLVSLHVSKWKMYAVVVCLSKGTTLCQYPKNEVTYTLSLCFN